MKGRQVRIFAQHDLSRRWSDLLIAKIVKPMSVDMEWFWFSRYHVENGYDSNDCDWHKIPRSYKTYLDDFSYTTRSIRFRYRPKNQDKAEEKINSLVRAMDGWLSDFRDYDPIIDLGSMTMLQLCQAASCVVLDGLDENGMLRKGAFLDLEKMHHRVCNIAHITDYRKLGINLVRAVASDFDNLRYDTPSRSPMWDHE